MLLNAHEPFTFFRMNIGIWITCLKKILSLVCIFKTTKSRVLITILLFYTYTRDSILVLNYIKVIIILFVTTIWFIIYMQHELISSMTSVIATEILRIPPSPGVSWNISVTSSRQLESYVILQTDTEGNFKLTVNKMLDLEAVNQALVNMFISFFSQNSQNF